MVLPPFFIQRNIGYLVRKRWVGWLIGWPGMFRRKPRRKAFPSNPDSADVV
jgi:hypothetical protein